MPTVLVVDNDAEFRKSLRTALKQLDYGLREASEPEGGLNLIQEHHDIDVILLSLNHPNNYSPEIIQRFHLSAHNPQIIVLTQNADPDIAAQVIHNGAWDYMEKPLTIPNLRLALQRALKHKKEDTERNVFLDQFQQEGIIGSSPCILNCLESLAKAAPNTNSVLLLGETGTGKELFARAIHNCGPRSTKPFVTVDCTSLPENLAESILQGHTRGSFTGAHADKTGLIKQADGGTLFLDEIGELPLSVQKSFLRIFQERTIRPLGGTRETPADFRLIAATNRDINTMVHRGEFRKDLYHRMSTFQITLPPLVKRTEDIKPMVQHFISRACQEFGLEEKAPSRDYIQALQQYNWPGNVRELINAVYASIDIAGHFSRLYPQHLPVNIRAQVIKNSVAQRQSGENTDPEHFSSDDDLLDKGPLPTLKEYRDRKIKEAEVNYMRHLLRISGNNVKEACRAAGISRPRFYELLKKHNMPTSNS